MHGICGKSLDNIRTWMDDQYLATGLLPGGQTLVAKGGDIVWWECQGKMDCERDKPVQKDTLYRIYSMTKPVVSVALMMLYEKGLFRLDEPIERYLPVFANPRVFVSGVYPNIITKPAARSITFTDLLTHQSGLTYGFQGVHPVDGIYRRLHLDTMAGQCELSLAEWTEQLAGVPLVFSPGDGWNYSVATDVIGRLVEVLSGQSLDAFLQQHIFAPLGMNDTSFYMNADKLERFAACYEWQPNKPFRLIDSGETSQFYKHSGRLSGGGGLISSTGDYYRFCSMLLRGGELDGVRILSPTTLAYMTQNHLYGGGDLASLSTAAFSEVQYQGVGFGLGFSVACSPVKTHVISSVGEYAWGGMASTAFWIDPAEELIVIFMTQLIPSSTYPIRLDLKAMVYGALQNEVSQ